MFSRKELKFIAVATVVGGILQLVCWKYLKAHPELVEDASLGKKEKGDESAIITITLSDSKWGVLRFRWFENCNESYCYITILQYIAEKGGLTGLGVAALSLSTILRGASPSSHVDFTKGYILIDGKKFCLDQCDKNLEYMFQILAASDVPLKLMSRLVFNN